MASLGDVVKLLAENIAWTTELGNAFLAQQSDVMDAVQRMRKKAKDSGKLKSSEQQIVDTQVVENKTVVVIEQANPQVVYVPSYDPVAVYGPPIYPYYPYPPIVYPPYYGAIAFGVGIAIGVAVGGGWGYGCGWGSNNVNINVNNNFINNSNRVNGGANRPAGGNNNWQHNPQHRGAAPYSDRATASKYGGSARGDSVATRPADTGGAGGRQPGTADRGAGGADRGGGGGGDRVGNRSVPSSPSASDRSAFGGAGGSSSSARASSQRGSSSMGGGRRGGGGGRRR
jgi:hypothetical protein